MKKKHKKARQALLAALVFILGGVLGSLLLDWNDAREAGRTDAPAAAETEARTEPAGVRVERLGDGPIIGPGLHPSIGVNIQGSVADPGARVGGGPTWGLLSLLRRPQGAVHPARLRRRSARAVEHPPAREPADRRFALPDRAAGGLGGGSRAAARFAGPARDVARRPVRGDGAAHRIAGRARRRREPPHRHVLSRPRPACAPRCRGWRRPPTASTSRRGRSGSGGPTCASSRTTATPTSWRCPGSSTGRGIRSAASRKDRCSSTRECATPRSSSAATRSSCSGPQVGDAPEHIKVSAIDLAGDWMAWSETDAVEVLRPEFDWEGADAPLEPSVGSTAYGHVNQLRDPAIFERAGGSSCCTRWPARAASRSRKSTSTDNAPAHPLPDPGQAAESVRRR